MTEKKNYCNEKGECDVWGRVVNRVVVDYGDCKHYSRCDYMMECEMCSFIDFDSDRCMNDKARKEAGVK